MQQLRSRLSRAAEDVEDAKQKALQPTAATGTVDAAGGAANNANVPAVVGASAGAGAGAGGGGGGGKARATSTLPANVPGYTCAGRRLEYERHSKDAAGNVLMCPFNAENYDNWVEMPPLCDYLSLECLGNGNYRSAHIFGASALAIARCCAECCACGGVALPVWAVWVEVVCRVRAAVLFVRVMGKSSCLFVYVSGSLFLACVCAHD